MRRSENKLRPQRARNRPDHRRTSFVQPAAKAILEVSLVVLPAITLHPRPVPYALRLPPNVTNGTPHQSGKRSDAAPVIGRRWVPLVTLGGAWSPGAAGRWGFVRTDRPTMVTVSR